ncbi:MAG: hypothetical protein R3336_05165 [Phycisphaeraceae bacterium]|nr:hypothetical protein [Phycisphaeraceae bacterium]
MSAAATNGSSTEVRARLAERDGDTIVLTVDHTKYRFHLKLDGELDAEPGDRVRGTIHARVRRVDAARGGGCYVEPVYGRPRRVQGRVVAADAKENVLTVRAAVPFRCRLMADQRAKDFPEGLLVGFDVERGASFKPAGSTATERTPVAPHTPSAPDEAVESSSPVESTLEEEKTRDEGALTDAEDVGITGQGKPTGETPISGDGS